MLNGTKMWITNGCEAGLCVMPVKRVLRGRRTVAPSVMLVEEGAWGRRLAGTTAMIFRSWSRGRRVELSSDYGVCVMVLLVGEDAGLAR